MSASLPPGWASSSIVDLACNEAGAITDGPFGSNLKTEHYTDDGPRVVRLQNIGEARFIDERAHISHVHFERLRKHEVRSGDVLVALLGEVLPRACVAPATLGEAIVKADCVRVRPKLEVVSAAYLTYALNSDPVRRQASAIVHGVGRPRLGLAGLRELRLPLAPRREQERIVAAIDQHLSDIDAGVAGLERVLVNVKHYRAAVLKAACEGWLVPKEVGSGSVGRPRVLAAVQVGWRTRTLGEVADVQGGIQKQPKRAPRDNRFPFLRVANVGRGRLDLSDVHEIELFRGELERLQLERGDLLIVEGNGSATEIGRMAIWDGSIQKCVHQNHIIRARVHGELLPEFVAVFWNSPAGMAQTTKIASSTSGLHTLSVSKVKSLTLPIPPMAEQRRIIDEVERLFSVADEVEQTIRSQLARAVRLRQAVLKNAFEGKVVAQDPSDEPARAVLERTRAERGVAKAPMRLRAGRRPAAEAAE